MTDVMVGYLIRGGLLCGLAVVTVGCGSLAQVRLGGEPKLSPDAKVILSHTCSGDESAARLYLDAPEFAWLGPTRERFLTDAHDAKLRGDCPCGVGGCPK